MKADETAVRDRRGFSHWLRGGAGLLAGVATLKLVLHLSTSSLYRYHRDELYLLACGKRLEWGSIDHAPMAPAASRILAILLGESPARQRVVASVASALVVWLTGLCARRLGGDRMAQVLAAGSVLIAPIFIFSGGVHGTNALDQLHWTLASYLLLLCFTSSPQTGGRPEVYWLLTGLVLGLGLLNKGTVAVYGFALLIGLAATPLRAHLRTPWPYLAATLAAVVWFPNFWWQVSHHFSGFEFLREHQAARMRDLSLGSFWVDQVRLIHPFSLSIALIGLMTALSKGARPEIRFFGIVFLSVLLVLLLLHGKPYYVAPAYTVLIAVGSVTSARAIGTWSRGMRRSLAAAWLVGGSVAFAGTLPVVPIELAWRWKLHRANPELSQFPDWRDLVSQISIAHRALGGSTRLGILTDSYGTAAAIEAFGPEFGLPKPFSGANGYYAWGSERADEPDELLAIGYPPELLRSAFSVVRQVGQVRNPWNLDNRFDFPRPLYHCQRKKVRLADLWPRLRHFD